MVGAETSWYASSWLYGLRKADAESAGKEGKVPWNFAQALSRMRPAKGSKLLDVGCAEGYFLHLARQMGYEVTGLDFDPVSLQMARELFGIDSVYQYRVEELHDRFPGTLFDAVTIFEVLEHTANPYQAVCSIQSVLKPGGRLFLSVPGSRRWPRIFHPEVDAPPHHLTLWTKEALVRLLERAGFRVHGVEVKPLEVDELVLHVKWRLHQAARKLRPQLPSDASSDEKVILTPEQGAHRKRNYGMVRDLAKTGLRCACWALRLNPRAGGFTLFADAENA
jgi:2-polyprenyl-3-methyl-5-hydroxy-6-metoxy-1,4-benzoquinol methylase